MSWAERNRALEQFEEREVDVLIGVDAIAEGVDVPHARAVFIARPTTSEVRYRQMVGRGARRTKTKKEFYVVDFVDNLTKHQDLLMTGRTIFGKRRPSEHMERPVRDRVKHIRHEFEDTTGCAYTPGPDVVPESIAELWHIKGQTFGVEFEVTRSDFVEGEVPDDWHEVAEVIQDALVEAFGSEEVGGVRLSYEHPTGKFDKWWVLWDSTVGWEVPSPILSGREGFEILEAACQALQKAAEECGLVLNHRTGTHVHLGWESFGDLDVIARGIKMVRAWEPAVATLVSPSRLREFLGWDEYAGHLAYDEDAPNEYCAPISHAFPEDILYPLDRRALRRALNDPDRRYTSVNFTRTDGGEGSTVEVRLHNGTLDPDKIAVWISLWQQILFAASQQVLEIPRTADVDLIEPSGDIIEFARLLPAARQGRHSFVERLARRRDAAGGRWEASMGVPPWQ
jgi:hypothetical protein